MKILFIGHRGVFTSYPLVTSDHLRVQQLSVRLAAMGHIVQIITGRRSNPSYIRHIQGVSITSVGGGWASFLVTLWHIWRSNPDVIHVHDWHSLGLVRLAALICPSSTFVWTVTSLPARISWITSTTAWQAGRLFDVIISPTRKTQYQLLTTLRVRSLYIPDGYEAPVLADIPAKHWGLKQEHYCVAEITNQEAVPLLVKAYKESKTRKKLVILLWHEMPYLKRIKRHYPFIVPIVAASDRARMSVMRQAAAVIIPEEIELSSFTLAAMDSGRPLIAVNHPLNQELLGTTGVFSKAGGVHDLAQAISGVIFYPGRQKQLGAKAAKRAQAHFTWERVIDEYVTAYHYPLVKRVPLDSVQGRLREHRLA